MTFELKLNCGLVCKKVLRNVSFRIISFYNLIDRFVTLGSTGTKAALSNLSNSLVPMSRVIIFPFVRVIMKITETTFTWRSHTVTTCASVPFVVCSELLWNRLSTLSCGGRIILAALKLSVCFAFSPKSIQQGKIVSTLGHGDLNSWIYTGKVRDVFKKLAPS